MPQFTILARNSVFSCILILFINSLHSHSYTATVAHSTIEDDRIICAESNDLNSKNTPKQPKAQWREIRIRSIYQTILSTYQTICSKISDSCGHSLFPVNVQKEAIPNLFMADCYFDPYINPEEPFYYVVSYNDETMKRDHYGFYFSNDRIGVRLFYNSVIIWFECDPLKRILNEKELFLLELMKKTKLSLYNDLIKIAVNLQLEMNTFAHTNHWTEATIQLGSVTSNEVKLYLENIPYKWLDTLSTLQPETYFSQKEENRIGSCLGLGVLIKPEGDVISDGLFTLNNDDYIYPIIGDIRVYGLRIPMTFLDEIISNN